MAVYGTFGQVNFEPENTPGLSGDYPGGIGDDSGMTRFFPNFIGDYRKILRGDYGGKWNLGNDFVLGYSFLAPFHFNNTI